MKGRGIKSRIVTKHGGWGGGETSTEEKFNDWTQRAPRHNAIPNTVGGPKVSAMAVGTL